MSAKGTEGLDVASTVGIVVAGLATVITAALARQMFTDISKFKDDDNYTDAEDNPKRKRANNEDKTLHAFYIFAVLFLFVYLAYIGYKEGMHQGAGGAPSSPKWEKSLKDYGISMAVLAYVITIMLILAGSMGIDMYKSGDKFGVVSADYPDGDKKKQAQNLYATYIAMVVIGVLAFVLLTAYLADAKKHAVKFYESWTASGASAGPAVGGTAPLAYDDEFAEELVDELAGDYELPESTYGSSFIV